MNSLPLRWRIISALIALSLGTSLALSLLARRFLDQSLQFSVNVEMGQALTDALALAKQNYDQRKVTMSAAGRQLEGVPPLLKAFEAGEPNQLRELLSLYRLSGVSLLFIGVSEEPELSEQLKNGSTVFKSPDREDRLQLRVPIHKNGRLIGALVVTEPLDELINVEKAVQTYKHLEMEEEGLQMAFLLAFLVAAAGVVIVACLVGIRIGFGITNPLYALIKGTREMARDNLDYRIPPARDDEIGLLIESFNRMAEDLKDNRRKRLEAEQIAAWREIARRLAHEIKNPLTPIQLTVQQMRDKYTGDDPDYLKLVTDCTEIVAEEVENLRALVQEFADFARMPSLSLSLNDLNAVIHDVVRLYPEARIQTDLLSDLPELNLDVEQIRRVLINLIENAIDAAGTNTPLTIHTRLEDETVIFRVADQGPGISAEDRDRIFQPYVSTKESGMGLGLAVVRTVIEDHHGSVTVGENADGGAAFEILLPVPEKTEVQS